MSPAGVDRGPCARPADPAPIVVAVAGVAGSGKTTLGRALARKLRLAILDLDQLTNPLLDAIAPSTGPHWLAGPQAQQVRAGRYAALRAAAADIVAVGVGVVLVAPFTAELAGGPEWEALRHSLSPYEPMVFYLDGPPGIFQARRARRGAARDHARTDGTRPRPHVQHAVIDATSSTNAQLLEVLEVLAAAGAIR